MLAAALPATSRLTILFLFFFFKNLLFFLKEKKSAMSMHMLGKAWHSDNYKDKNHTLPRKRMMATINLTRLLYPFRPY